MITELLEFLNNQAEKGFDLLLCYDSLVLGSLILLVLLLVIMQIVGIILL